MALKDLISQARKSKLGRAISNLDRDKQQSGFQFTSPSLRSGVSNVLRDSAQGYYNVGQTFNRRVVDPLNANGAGDRRAAFTRSATSFPRGAYKEFKIPLHQEITQAHNPNYKIKEFNPEGFGEKAGKFATQLVTGGVEFQNIGAGPIVDQGIQSIASHPTTKFVTGKTVDYSKKQISRIVQNIKPLKITFKDLRDVTANRGTPEQLVKFNKFTALKDKGMSVKEILKAGERENPLTNLSEFVSRNLTKAKSRLPESPSVITYADKGVEKQIVVSKPDASNWTAWLQSQGIKYELKNLGGQGGFAKVGKTPKPPIIKTAKPRGLTTSVQEAKNISDPTKEGVDSTFITKTNDKLMGEAKALLEEGASISIKGVRGIDKKIAATMQEAINLDKAGDSQAAANLYNNLSEQGTELGRAVQAFSMLEKMSPESIAISAAGRIRKYNASLKPGARRIPELSGDQVKVISDIVKKIDGLTGREKNLAINDLQNTINSFIPSTRVDKAITVWKAGLLTSFRTHERNIVGNTIMSTSEFLKDIPATLADKALSIRTGQRTTTFTGRGAAKGALEGAKTGRDILQHGFDPENAIGKYEVQRVNWGKSKTGKFLKVYTDAVFRTLGGADKPFWKSSFARSLYDQAGANAINVGRQGDAKFITKLVNKPTEEMLLQAAKDANATTFQDKNILSKIAGSIKKTARKNEFTKLLSEMFMPFTGVPSSVVMKTIDYSPIGLIRGIANAGNVAVKNIPELQREAAQQIGRGTIGTAIFALGAYLMKKGLMTGQAKDQKERDLWKAQNKTENSVFIDGKWRGINSIGPQNLILLAGAKYNENANDDDGSFAKYGAAMGKDQLSQTFLQGVQGPLQAVNDPDRYGESYVGRTGASVIPNIVKDAARSIDKTDRETNTIADYFAKGIPGVRNTLLPKRTVLGEEIKQEPTGAGAFIDLFNSKTPIDTDITNELSRLNDEGTPATPSKISKSFTLNNRKVTMTPEQLDSFEQGSGELLRPQLSNLIKSSEYQAMTNDKKKKAITNLVSDVRSDYKKANIASLTSPYKLAKDEIPEGVNKFAQNTIATITNPIETTQGKRADEVVRKVVFPGDTTFEKATKFLDSTVVFARDTGANKLDIPGLEADHTMPLWAGGLNDPKNISYLQKDIHSSKTKFDENLRQQYLAGDITQKEARQAIQENFSSLPSRKLSQQEKNDLTPSLVDTKDQPFLNEVFSMPSTNRFEKSKKDSKLFSSLNTIENNENLNQQQKEALLDKVASSLGRSREDLETYKVAKEDNNTKTLYVLDQLDTIQSNEELLQFLIKGRQIINGKLVVSDGVINNLVDEGIISKEIGKKLKKLDLNEDGSTKKSASRSSSSGSSSNKKRIRAIQTAQNKLFSDLRKIGSSSSIRTSAPVKIGSTKGLTLTG